VLLAAVALAGAVAATIDGQPITIDALDAPASQEVERLHDALHDAAVAGVERLVAEAIESTTPSTEETADRGVGDADVDRFRAEHRADVARMALDTASERAAVRHYLEERARADRARRLRAGRAVVVAVPEGRLLEQPLSARRKIARVDAVAIRAAALEQVAALPLYRARGELYLARKRRLDAMIDERLLARASTPSEQPGPTVSDDELQAYVEAERRAGRAIADAERVRPYLAFQKTHRARAERLEALRAGACIEVLLRPPPVPHLPEDEGGAPALGPPGGRTLILYSNYRCDTCRAVHREVDRLRATDPDVRIVFRDFVPVYDPVATEGAWLVRCAATLGVFEAMRRVLLERDPPAFGQRWVTDDGLPALAATLGVDASTLAACLSASETAATVGRDSARARDLGFTEAPAMLARGKPLSGMQSVATLASALR
jgi:Thioredoxin